MEKKALARCYSRRILIWLVFLAAASVLCGCAGPHKSPQAMPDRSRSDATASTVGAFLDPDVFREQAVKADESGPYVQVDDMRFRVNEIETFAFRGHQWPNGTLAYDFSPQVRADAFKVQQFREACRILTDQSGVGCIDVRMNPIDPQNHVYVVDDPNINYSYIGRIGGRQTLGIYNWNYLYIIAHEIKHALGWVHEHQRPDRNQYVKINWANVDPKYLHNFSISPGPTNSPYDFESVMHYDRYAFSQNGLKTIEALPQYSQYEPLMGQRDHASSIDLSEIIGVYGAKGLEWCGLTPYPRRGPPEGCFFSCYRALDQTYGRWWMCGSCPGAETCP